VFSFVTLVSFGQQAITISPFWRIGEVKHLAQKGYLKSTSPGRPSTIKKIKTLNKFYIESTDSLGYIIKTTSESGANQIDLFKDFSGQPALFDSLKKYMILYPYPEVEYRISKSGKFLGMDNLDAIKSWTVRMVNFVFKGKDSIAKNERFYSFLDKSLNKNLPKWLQFLSIYGRKFENGKVVVDTLVNPLGIEDSLIMQRWTARKRSNKT
jgi:hypothetical protein